MASTRKTAPARKTDKATPATARPQRKRRPVDRVTLADIANAAGLSVAAVSMALADQPSISQATKRRVVRLCRELGYHRPGQDRGGTTQPTLRGKAVGVVIVGSRSNDVSSVLLLHHLAIHLQQQGGRMQVTAVESHDPRAAVRPTMDLARHVDGLILVGYVDRALLTHLSELDTPMIVLGLVLNPADVPLPERLTMVAPDELGMGRLATAALLAQGHRRVAYICEHAPVGLSHHQWLQGYQLAHLEMNVPIAPELVHVAGRPNVGGEPAARALTALKNPPTAVVVPDAPMVRSFLDACQALGHPMSEAVIVCGGQPERAAAANLHQVGRVYCEHDRLTRTGLDILARKMQGLPLTGLTHLLHPTCLRLPAR
jgi:DNA-binding LacI/PurR family transcriptional regulator